ncbi:uncharacterized protein LOC116433415 [Nomia melanderi]|uniref:uncharacterized protein LOC116433415 n=1 Tax=Nomia melanderi TaxID=2448451 RepID=UPI0013043E44|nr:uncharacterized protein LOC116433415 [Nomia melanderi]
MWIFYVALIVSSGVHAFPQNNNGARDDGRLSASFEVDGFVFDGPADGPADGGSVTQTPLRTTSSTTVTTTTANSDMTACMAACPGTPEYNPVCGSNRLDYDNPGRLNCAAVCGIEVTISYFGKCSSAAARG